MGERSFADCENNGRKRASFRCPLLSKYQLLPGKVDLNQPLYVRHLSSLWIQKYSNIYKFFAQLASIQHRTFYFEDPRTFSSFFFQKKLKTLKKIPLHTITEVSLKITLYVRMATSRGPKLCILSAALVLCIQITFRWFRLILTFL